MKIKSEISFGFLRYKVMPKVKKFIKSIVLFPYRAIRRVVLLFAWAFRTVFRAIVKFAILFSLFPRLIFRKSVALFRFLLRKLRLILKIAFVAFVLIIAGGYGYLYLKEKKFLHDEVAEFLDGVDFDVFVILAFTIVALFFLVNLFVIYRVLRSKNVKILYFLVFNALAILSLLGIFSEAYFTRHPNLIYNYPTYDKHLNDYSKPLVVKFNLPVRVDKLKPSIVQEWQGEWVWEPYLGMSEITRVGKFYPSQTVLPDQRFVVYVAGINKLTDEVEHEYGYVFRSPTYPQVLNTYPVEGSDSVTRTDPIILNFDKSYSDLIDLDVKFEPSLEYEIQNNGGNQALIFAKDKLPQGKTFKVEVSRIPKIINLNDKVAVHTENPEKIFTLNFSTVKEPLIDEFTPSGNKVIPSENIKIKFSEEMNMETVLENIQVNPQIAGEWSVLDDKNIEFIKSEDLKKDTEYKVKILTGSRSKKGGVVSKDIEYTFRTLGAVQLQGTSPGNNENYVNEFVDIRVEFDQQVDKESAQANFQISPSLSGNFVWEGNTMIFDTTQKLNFQTRYTVTIKSGVKSIHGLDSNQDHSFGFTTRSEIVLFYVPMYYQPAGFACNIFTAKMVMAWKGHYADHVSLISEIGYNPNRSGDQWTGNPYREYVGNGDGSWGYGVYYPPIQRLLANRGISSEAKVGSNINELAKSVEQGHPVIIWRYNGVGGGQNISWTASDGSYIPAFNGMHGSVVTGVIGGSSNPTSFFINDPWLGQFWINASSLDYYWSFSGRMSLVVY